MSRRNRILLIVGGSLLGLVLLVAAAAFMIVQTAWFQDYVRRKIVAVTEESTGGRVELQSFAFDWKAMRATMRGFTIRGLEPAGAPPLLTTDSVQVELKLLSGLKKAVDLRSLVVERPQANVIVFADGTTNIPSPKIKKKPNDKSPLETVVDLAVGRVEIDNGLLQFEQRKIPLNLHAENLELQLAYNLATPRYEGQLSAAPIRLGYANKQPVDLTLNLPVVLERDRIRISDGRVTSPESNFVLNGAVTDMKDPKIEARLNGRVSLAEVARFTDLKIARRQGLPDTAEADVAVRIGGGEIEIDSGRLTLGNSNVEASGLLKGPSTKTGLEFKTTLDLAEVSGLFGLAAAPQGQVQANGKARLPDSGFEVEGNVVGRNVSFVQDGKRIRNINLNSAFRATPQRIDLQGMNLAAFGGRFTGNASLEDMSALNLEGRLENLDIRTAGAAFMKEPLPYEGRVSGPVKIQGNIKAPGTSGLNADVKLSIAPGKQGIPVSGRLNGRFEGATGQLQVTDSSISLPNSKLQISGELGKQMKVQITSRRLEDFLPESMRKSFPVVLHGPATFDGTVSGNMNNPRVAGHLTVANFEVSQRHFDALTADVAASRDQARVMNAVLSRGPMRTTVDGTLGLRNWKPLPESTVTAAAKVSNGDLADIVALAGKPDLPVAGALSATASVSGTFGNPLGALTVDVVKGSAWQEPFDQLRARVEMADRVVRLADAFVSSGPSRIEVSGRFDHPRESFTTGHVDATIQTRQVTLESFRQLLKNRPGLAGSVNMNAHVTGDLTANSQFQLSSVNGDFGVRGLRADGQAYGDLNGTARTAGNTVTYQVRSNFAGSALSVDGATRLEPGYATQASAIIRDLPIERVLALARRSDIEASGKLSGTARVNGPMDRISGDADVTLADAQLYGQPVERVAARVSVQPDAVELSQLDINSGPSRIRAAATYKHAVGDYLNGQAEFHIRDSRIQLSGLRRVQQKRPGLSGLVELSADGAATTKRAADGSADVQVSRVNANVDARTLRINNTDLGGMRLVAKTKGDIVNFSLESNIAKADIRGSGTATLRGNYPVKAQLKIGNVTYSGLRPLVGAATSTPNSFDVLTEGQLTIDGPAKTPEQMTARLELPTVRVTAAASAAQGSRTLRIENRDPVLVTLENYIVRIRSARFFGPQTNIRIAGAIPLRGVEAMNVNVSARANLALIQEMSRDIYSEGIVLLQAVARGTISEPQLNGRLELRNASLNYIDLPNGLSNARGVIVFNGKSVAIESLVAESGGGKVTVSGFAGLNRGLLTYNVRAAASSVRVRYPPGLSVVASASVNLTGNTERSLLSGVTTIESLGFSPRQDFGSLLSRTAEPVKTPEAPSGPLQGMRLDVRIRTSPTASFSTTMAQNLQADASLNLRGTITSPGLIGRVNITQGELVFFGSQYTVNQGTVAFYNPLRIEPVLNVDLETLAKGVRVNLNVAGPIDNMKLTYTSDPPLQFNEVIALLATGKTPTSDPNLLAREPAAPPQSLQQMGGSAILSRAIANPVASRLERVFGVNKLKIDPTFTSGSELPQARLTLQQQITSRITFTYITNLAQTNAQIVRMEWAFDDNWSAIATREENGRFGVDFFFKKKFR
ncbi:MAG: translocation/assembly module TamB domain-containing protein [Bryobacterales bacterium]|nr:translocation/assembly module TamB domain-containing protein [Bryobacterales bacterium]